MKNSAKEKVMEFTNEIKLLQSELNDSRLEKFIQDTEDLIQYNEFGIALENLLTNLYEFEIKIKPNHISLAKEAMQKMKMNWEDWKFIEELAKEDL